MRLLYKFLTQIYVILYKNRPRRMRDICNVFTKLQIAVDRLPLSVYNHRVNKSSCLPFIFILLFECNILQLISRDLH